MNVVPIFSEQDKDLLSYSWRKNKWGYASRHTSRDGEKFRISAHQEVIERVTGRIPRRSERLCIDHINGDRLDCRRENLRVVSYGVNGTNTKSSRGAAHITFDPNSGKWQAQPAVCGRALYLGQWENKEDAEAASLAFLEYCTNVVRPMFMRKPSVPAGITD